MDVTTLGRYAATFIVLNDNASVRSSGYPLSLQLREYGHRSRVTLMVTWTPLFPNVLIPERPNTHTSLLLTSLA